MTDDSPDNFPQRFSYALQEANISKQALADLLGITPSTISGWLSGKRPSLPNLVAISRSLNLSLNWLVAGEGNIYRNGPLHLNEAECRLVQLMRKAPGDCIDSTLAFIASLLGIDRDTLVERAHAHRTLSAMPLPMFIDDNETILHDINDAFLEMLAFPFQERQHLLGRPVLDLIDEADRAQFFYHSRQCMDNQHNHHFHCHFVSPAQNKKVQVAISRVHHGDRQSGFFFTTLFPIPEKH
ncbi:MAG TPA: helix-turn-helix domain-containing protein [Pseudomonadales bacterium]